LVFLLAENEPFASTELGRGAKGLIKMIGNQTILEPPEDTSAKGGRATEKKPMNFTFDKSYWSAGERTDPDYCSQQTLYEDLGSELLDHAFAGFNACILACRFWLPSESYRDVDLLM
jgi:kinesin family protein 1